MNETLTNNGILKEALRSPVIKDMLRINLKGMRPDAGSSFVQTLMGEDPEVFLALVSSLPVIINSLIKAFTELATQLENNYPPEILKQFIQSLYEDIDRDAARQCMAALLTLTGTLLSESGHIRQLALLNINIKPETIAHSINKGAHAFNSIEPDKFESFIAGIIYHVDKAEISRAARTITGAFMNQNLHLGSWIFGLVWNMIKRPFLRHKRNQYE